jgi:hypothetical protein
MKIISHSTRSESIVTEEQPSESVPTAQITREQYLAAILAGYPGQGTMIESAYSQAPPGCVGSRANGMFL